MTEKLSSSEVPIKFGEWLLAMGCPPDIVPTSDKMIEMCRGHYMVWRSLMEHVEPKDVVRQKRLQVFCDDMRKWKRKNTYRYQKDTETVITKELDLWNQHCSIKEKVANAENRVGEIQNDLNQLMDKISAKLAHCNLSRQRLRDIQRRVWLLQQVTEQLTTEKENLEETKTIANSLCLVDEDVDLQSKLDKYMSSLRRPVNHNVTIGSNPAASSTIVSTNSDVNDTEELSWVGKCRGDALWSQLYERRAALVTALFNDAVTPKRKVVGTTPGSVLAHTAAMHCTLALEAMKNRALVKQRKKMLAAAVLETGSAFSNEECELLVLQCERAHTNARVNTMHALLHDLTSRQGVFNVGPMGNIEDKSIVKQIVAMDKTILSKREEVEKLVTSLAVTEKKIESVRECLEAMFNGFQNETTSQHLERYRGLLDIPQDSMYVIRQFYETKREARRNKLQLSLEFDVSENSYSEGIENRSPKFVDELKIYLKHFNLEKNRKLVLESGEKIWIFETLQYAVSRLYSLWLDKELSCALLCPSVGLSRNLEVIWDYLQRRQQLERALDTIQCHSVCMKPNVNIDITLKMKNEEDEILDKIKKRLNDNILSLQKTNKTLDGAQENLKFWADNEIKKYISLERKVEGKSYQDYELLYNELINLNKP